MSEITWEQRSDEELLAAAAQINQYTPPSQQEIRSELARRNLIQQGPLIGGQDRNRVAQDAFFWRGLVGGAIGCCIYLTYLSFQHWTRYGFALSLGYLPVWVIEGGIIGLIIGLGFWSLYTKTEGTPSLLSRILIGACFTFIIAWLFQALTGEGVTAPFSSWQAFILAGAFSLAVGGLSGAMARPRRGKEEPGESDLH
jgi:hypothetical protein